MNIDNVNSQTTFADVAYQVMNFIQAGYAVLSFVPESGNLIELEVNQKEIISGKGSERVELLTGFYSTGLSCYVKEQEEFKAGDKYSIADNQ